MILMIARMINVKKQKQKLTYHFHNPNTDEVLADFLLKLFVEANYEKILQQVLQDSSSTYSDLKTTLVCK